MKKKEILWFCSLLLTTQLTAEDLKVTRLHYDTPYKVIRPVEMDSVDVNNRKRDTSKDQATWQTARFKVENNRYTPAKLIVKGIGDFTLLVDRKKTKAEKDTAKLNLEPGTHEIRIQYTSTSSTQRPDITLHTDKDGYLSLKDNDTRLLTLKDITDGKRAASVEMSPDGRYLITVYRTVLPGGKTLTSNQVSETASGRIVSQRTETLHWMPRTNKYYYTRNGAEGKEMVLVSPLDGQEEVWAKGLPQEGSFEVSPSEDYLLFTLTRKGPKEKKEIFEVVDPDDRQAGWRDRSYPALFDLKTRTLQPLTFGYNNVDVSDISSDGQKLLLMKSERRLTQRPTTLYSLFIYDMRKGEATPLVEKDGFINNASFSPDGKKILLTGSPECLGGIGKNVEKGQIPSMIDNQLYLMNLADKKITPLTKDFNPNPQRVSWSKADGMVYFTAENKDSLSLYRLNPANREILLIHVPEDMVMSFTLANNAKQGAWIGESASNSDRIYTLSLTSGKSQLKEDLSKTILQNVELGECKPWNFTNSRGDTIYGRYYLPPHFDPKKKYPMIVNYYGGCSPTSRNFESRYPHHLYAALGYVVYVVNPSGATGFGQKFSARHVNTYGDYTADDIIEGVKRFMATHPFVNKRKVGCIGASYGGFMTQYLQTKTDLFAAAISHAGISDIAGYWGYGYWGYSYSEISAAGSYPWNNKPLYVDHSPLYQADKIHTPLLFLHGTADMNVPTAQGIAMYTALKLLGRPTALVEVEGQGHHVTDYQKRVQWENTIHAWFAKYLQDDSTWWDALYPPKKL